MKNKKKLYLTFSASITLVLSLILFLSTASAPPMQSAFPTFTETQITTNESDQDNLAIYGDKIVWQDNRNGNYDIYMYNISTLRKLKLPPINLIR